MGRLRLGRRLPAVVPDRRDVKAVSGRGAPFRKPRWSACQHAAGWAACQPVSQYLLATHPPPARLHGERCGALFTAKRARPTRVAPQQSCHAEVLNCLQRGSNLVANCSNSSPGSLGLLLRRDGGCGWSRPGRPSAGRSGRGPFRLEPRGPRPDCSGRCRVWDPALWPGL